MGQTEDRKGSEVMADGNLAGRMDVIDPFKDPFLAPRNEDVSPDDLFDGDW